MDSAERPRGGQARRGFIATLAASFLIAGCGGHASRVLMGGDIPSNLGIRADPAAFDVVAGVGAVLWWAAAGRAAE